ncbi:hypothetical protein ACHAXT_009438 [Thalassiosira profunda]
MDNFKRSKKEPLLGGDVEASDGRATPASASGRITPLSIGTGSAVPANNDGNSLPPHEEGSEREKKVGHNFFFCCCDSKRAVVWLNTMILMINLFTITYAAVNSNPSAEGYTRHMIMQGCGMFVTFATLLGAYWYSKEIVLVGLCFACYQLVVGIAKVAKYDWQSQYNEEGKLETLFPMVFYTLVFYAEAVFMYEVYVGTMSAETYKRRERHCCCCNC